MLATLRAAVADPTQVKTRAIDLHANAHDASHFLLVPQAVVVAGNAGEVGALMSASVAQGMPRTRQSFRTRRPCGHSFCQAGSPRSWKPDRARAGETPPRELINALTGRRF